MCDGAEIVGVGGLEIHGEFGLLRSVVVADRLRGQGIGKTLVDAVEASARNRGVASLLLLTETAADFFGRLGYSEIARVDVPQRIRNSAEFRDLCPQSARCMIKRIT